LQHDYTATSLRSQKPLSVSIVDCPFHRELKQLCDLAQMALREPAKVEQVRTAVGESRRLVAARREMLHGNHSPEVDRFHGRFLRLLAAADQQLGPAEGSELATYVDQHLSTGRLPGHLPRAAAA